MATSAQNFYVTRAYDYGGYYSNFRMPGYGQGTVTDTRDPSTSDDTSQLGDIDDDIFSFNGNNYTFVTSTTQGGFIAQAQNNNLYLFRYGGYGRTDYYYANSSNYVICFTTGVRIDTARGPVAVENLAVGDVALTAFGVERPIRWIGSRTVDCSGENAHMAPVRVMANAFGAGVPERDVYLSPGHPVLVGQDGAEVFVPIMNLINGTTIERTSMQSVTYWHVELDEHDVLLADGLPAESFFDMGSRGWFDNDLDDVLANPDLVPLASTAVAARWRSTAPWSTPSASALLISSPQASRRNARGRRETNTPFRKISRTPETMAPPR